VWSRYANPGAPPLPKALDRVIRRALQRLRGEQNIDRLVADGLELGRGSFIARGVYLDPGHPWLITIGDETGLSPGTIVMAHDASMRHHMGFTRIARVVIGSRVFVGAGAIILPGSSIGDDSIVGAGAVVRGFVPPSSLVVGNPAKVVSDVESVAEWHRQAASDAPVWPHEGWTIDWGITEARKRAQREALADGVSGYLSGVARPATGPLGATVRPVRTAPGRRPVFDRRRAAEQERAAALPRSRSDARAEQRPHHRDE
jgi:maltose O-acetyltransferase